MTQWHTAPITYFPLIPFYIHKENQPSHFKTTRFFYFNCFFFNYYFVCKCFFLFFNDSLHQPIICSLIQAAGCWLAVWAHSHHPAHHPLCATTTTERQHFTAPWHTLYTQINYIENKHLSFSPWKQQKLFLKPAKKIQQGEIISLFLVLFLLFPEHQCQYLV